MTYRINLSAQLEVDKTAHLKTASWTILLHKRKQIVINYDFLITVTIQIVN